DSIISKLDNPKKGLIFVSNNVFSLINSNAVSLDNLTNNKDELVKFLNAIAKGKIDSSAANKNILNLLLSKTTTDKVINNSKKNSFDSKELEKIVDNLITKNKDMISKEYESRPERIEKMIMGQVMKETKGGASPQETIKLIKTKLK
ncbi:MAG: hypothetical protein HRS57_03315, partial [Mycoplasmataceae bacterium]|nr:hypothetical protein [Mycoplasmataceae bacterium]